MTNPQQPPLSPSQKKRKKKKLRKRLRPIRHWLTGRGLHLLHWICTRLTHRGALTFGSTLGRIGYFLARGERKKTLRHLEMAFGNEMTAERREAISRELFRNLGMNAAEALLSTRWSDDEVRRVTEATGAENVRAHQQAGQGAVYVTGHFGNWELMIRACACHLGVHPGIIVRESQNPHVDQFMAEMRANKKNPIFSTNDSALKYIRALKKGSIIGMLADQDTKYLSSIHVNYFGRPALTPAGPAFLARRTGVPIIPIFMHRRDDHPTRHVFRVYPPIIPDPALGEQEDTRRMLQEFTSALEGEVRERPAQWVWMHERWRHTPDKMQKRVKKEKIDAARRGA